MISLGGWTWSKHFYDAVLSDSSTVFTNNGFWWLERVFSAYTNGNRLAILGSHQYDMMTYDFDGIYGNMSSQHANLVSPKNKNVILLKNTI